MQTEEGDGMVSNLTEHNIKSRDSLEMKNKKKTNRIIYE